MIMNYLSLIMAFLTFSRMGLIALLALSLKKIWLSIIIILIFCIIYFLDGAKFFEGIFLTLSEFIRIPNKFNIFLDTYSTQNIILNSARTQYWVDSVRLIIENPYGVGIGESSQYIGLNPYKNNEFVSEVYGNTPHNVFLNMILELGIIFGTIAIILWSYILLNHLRYVHYSFFICVFITIFFLDTHLQSPVYLLSIVLYLLHIKKNERVE